MNNNESDSESSSFAATKMPVRTGAEITVFFRPWSTFLTCSARWNRAPLISVSVLTRFADVFRRWLHLMQRLSPNVFWLALMLLNPCVYGQDPANFEQQIRPLLLQHCGKCHGPTAQKSGLRLDARHGAFKGGDSGPVIVPGKSIESDLLRRVQSADPDDRMPPDGPPLEPHEITLLQRWIDGGAQWLETDYDREAAVDPRLQHWAFQPLKPIDVPEIGELATNASAALNEIDHFIIAKLGEHDLALNPIADRRTLIRRLAFDVTGLPASFEDVAAFEASDDSTAWVSLVEAMLASPRYGERWAQHWLDVIRYADTHGFEVNTPRENAWPYRDYVIQALNEDKPYDQFVREQLAGDVFQADAATGFMVASAVLLPGQIGADDVSKRLARQDALDEIVVGTSGSLLGLTIGCARCHDHKFDPITQQDYYNMQAFFAGVDYGDRPIRDANDMEQKSHRAAQLAAKIQTLESTLRQFEPLAFADRTLIINEDDPARTTTLKCANGPGNNPEGTQRGYRDDQGDIDRVGNLSAGHYTWWNNVPREDVLTWNPGVEGTFELWISWGAHGSGVHTRDARYFLDSDGDLTTRDDQHELATVDQYYMAGTTAGETEQKPLWSGLKSVGRVTLMPVSSIVLRGGDTGTGITADVIVLQETAASSTAPVADSAAAQVAETTSQKLPRLRPAVSAKVNVEFFDVVIAKYVRFTAYETINNNQHEPCIDELEVYSATNPPQNVALATHGTIAVSSGNYSDIGSHQLRHINDGQYGNDRSWISDARGGGWVQLEFPVPVAIDRVVWGRDRNEEFKDRLPIRYAISTSLDGQEWTSVARGDDRVPMGTPFDPVPGLLRNQSPGGTANLVESVAELSRLQAEKKQLETPRMVYGGTFRDPDRTYLLRRGDPEQPLDETSPVVPAMFSQTFSDAVNLRTAPRDQPLTSEQQRRLNLANWIASSQNPLTARVLVNRIWQQHFGLGLVATPNDFGINGVRPSHPELLDWLAQEFIDSGWSIKHLHRLILNSATYRQSSLVSPQASAVDRDNRLLWRFASRRLEAEAVRDCMLSVSGELNLTMSGPGFSFFKTRGGLDGFPPVEDFTAENMRRMVYAHKVRMEPVPVFGAFDCPDAGQATPRRGRSTTAIQALNLFNSQFVLDRADKLATRAVEAATTSDNRTDDVDAQIRALFRIVLARDPTSAEAQQSHAVVATHGISPLSRALLNCSEFLFVP